MHTITEITKYSELTEKPSTSRAYSFRVNHLTTYHRVVRKKKGEKKKNIVARRISERVSGLKWLLYRVLLETGRQVHRAKSVGANKSAEVVVRGRHHFHAISTWLDLSGRSSVRVITGIINYICPLVPSDPGFTPHLTPPRLPPSILIRTVHESMEKYRIRLAIRTSSQK